MTVFLLDTHIFLWFIQGDVRLSDRMKALINDDTSQLYLSSASLWEIAIKLNIGKLKINHTIDDLYQILDQLQVEVLSIAKSDLNVYRELPLHHRDPFDRLLIAQSISRQLILVSVDEVFTEYSVQRF